jgi:hypothetical protein
VPVLVAVDVLLCEASALTVALEDLVSEGVAAIDLVTEGVTAVFGMVTHIRADSGVLPP